RGQMMLNAALEKAQMEIKDDRLIIRFEGKPTELFKKVSNKESKKVITETARAVLGTELKIDISMEDGSTVSQQEAAEEDLRNKAEADPTVQLFKKTFKGEISKVERTEE